MEGEGREIEKGGEGGGGRRSRKMGKGWLGGEGYGEKGREGRSRYDLMTLPPLSLAHTHTNVCGD